MPPWIRMKEPWGSVITWGLLLRIDSAFLKLHYSEEIRRYAMVTPDKIARAVIARRGGRPT
jgi:hypothetical protein